MRARLAFTPGGSPSYQSSIFFTFWVMRMWTVLPAETVGGWCWVLAQGAAVVIRGGSHLQPILQPADRPPPGHVECRRTRWEDFAAKRCGDRRDRRPAGCVRG